MGERARVENNEIDTVGCRLLDPVDELVLGIALESVKLMPELFRKVYAVGLNILQARGPINLGLAGAEQVQVGTIEQQEFRHFIANRAHFTEDAGNSSEFRSR